MSLPCHSWKSRPVLQRSGRVDILETGLGIAVEHCDSLAIIGCTFCNPTLGPRHLTNFLILFALAHLRPS